MEPHEELIRWATGSGVVLNGIKPKRIPGRGIGIVATRPLKENEILLQVPTSALRTLDTVPRSISRKLPKEMTVHGLLAAELALDKTGKFAAWDAVVPSSQDLEDSMPLAWDPQLQDLLPPPALALVRKQQAKLARDWAAASSAFPSLRLADFRHAWLVVNTRTFYHTTPRTERLRLPRDDRMALQPVTDLFNHTDFGGCGVAYDGDGFAVTVAPGTRYRRGEEVFVSYGRHGNDFLLAEYGFVLGANRWDEAGIDDAVLPALGPRQRQRLEEAGFLGGYVLDAAAVCHRTQVALRILCLPLREWRRFVDGADDSEAHQGEVDRLLGDLLARYRAVVEGVLDKIDGLEAGIECQREVLKGRWRQILELIDATIGRLDA